MDSLILHLAFVCIDIDGTNSQLVSAGAVLLPVGTAPAGDQLATLHDPWGLAILLCKRAEPMV